MEEIGRGEVGYSVTSFWKSMDQWCMHPEWVFRRISFIQSEELQKEEEGQNRVVKRMFFSKIPERDPSITDLVTFDKTNNSIIFSPELPEGKENDESYLPVYYPNVKRYSYSYEQNDGKNQVVVRAELFSGSYKEKMKAFTAVNIKKLSKWAMSEENGGYSKRVNHDLIVPHDLLYKTYHDLKQKYKFWVSIWPEQTDPEKFVFEEMGIAAFLIAMFTLERQQKGIEKKQSFVDLGCGNGFLVYLLANEGYHGKGIDIAERSIWQEYNKHGVPLNLVVETLYPDRTTFPDVDWIVGNHSDELTPWIPFIASKTPNTRFFVLPCCMFDFNGKFQRPVKHKIGRYATYLDYIEYIGKTVGYQVEREALRIPSTKNISLIGRTRTIDPNDPEQLNQLESNQKELMKDYTGVFNPRITDREKHRKRQQKQADKKKSKQRKKGDKDGEKGKEEIVSSDKLEDVDDGEDEISKEDSE